MPFSSCINAMAEIDMKTPKKNNHAFTTWIIYINIALYATCFQIQRPLEPYLVEQLKTQGGAHASVEYARLQSFFGIVQTVGSLISGLLLDKFGIRGSFLLSFLASAASYAVLSQAHSMDLLYYSKIPSAFQSAFLCAQAAIAQFTDGPDRAKALGMLTMSYTVGSVLGPTIGGIIGASGDYYFGAKLAVVGSVLSVILTLVAIHDEPKEPKETAKEDAEAKIDKSTSSVIQTILRSVWVLLSAKVISSVANAMFQAIFPLVLKNQFAFSEQALGITMSVSSFISAIVNGFLLGKIVDYFNGDLVHVIIVCITGLSVCSILQGLFALPDVLAFFPTQAANLFLSVYFFSNVFQYVLATTITSASTTLVKDESKGTLLGLEHSLFAAARIGAPQVGVAILLALSNEGGVGGYGITGVAFTAAFIYQIVQALMAFGSMDQLAETVSDAERKEK